MEFGIMFFANASGSGPEAYRLLVEAARFADRRGFAAVWTPERHFHAFGGLFPNPAVTSAALATITEQVELRAGSLVLPLHDPLRAAEDWALVDNLSNGRVAISFGSGWNVDDFVLAPSSYPQRQQVMYDGIELMRRLWRGESVERPNGAGKATEVRIFPRPVRPELPIWITSSGNAETFASAGRLGANLLTHLIGQDLDTLREKIAHYRAARAEVGLEPAAGKVALMLHTFLGQDAELVRQQVSAPFRRYLASAVSLERMSAIGGGAISGGHQVDPHQLPPEVLEELLDLTFERYYQTASLMGVAEERQQLIWELAEAGVDEIACLIDFLDDPAAVLEALEPLDQLRQTFAGEAVAETTSASLNAFMEDFDA